MWKDMKGVDKGEKTRLEWVVMRDMRKEIRKRKARLLVVAMRVTKTK